MVKLGEVIFMTLQLLPGGIPSLPNRIHEFVCIAVRRNSYFGVK